MNSKIKKNLFLLLCIFETVFVFSVTKKEPIWFKDFKSIYPETKYIVQIGSGETEEQAQNSSIALIARFFQTNVSSNLSTKMVSILKNDKAFDELTVIDDIEVTSTVNLFALKFEETYYSKKEKQYYSLAYINRDSAWDLYKSQIEMSKSTFYSFFNKAEETSEPFIKYIKYKQAWVSAKDILEKLKYGNLLNPKKNSIYSKDREVISSLPILMKDISKTASIYVSVKGDYNNILGNSVKQLFINEGFEFSKTGTYTLFIGIEPNVEGNEPLTIYPSVYVELSNSKGDIFFTYDYTHHEKTIAYALETAQRKVYPKIAEIISTEIKVRLNDELNKE